MQRDTKTAPEEVDSNKKPESHLLTGRRINASFQVCYRRQLPLVIRASTDSRQVL